MFSSCEVMGATALHRSVVWETPLASTGRTVLSTDTEQRSERNGIGGGTDMSGDCARCLGM